MAFLRKSSAEPDDQLPLTAEQAATLRRLVREAFGAHGREVVVEADHVRDDTGTEFGLWNLAVLCGQYPQRKWSRLVGSHVASLMSPANDLDAISEEELVDLVHLRLHSTDAGFDIGAHTVGEVIPGLTTVLAVDLPTMVTSPQTSFWEERGGVARWTAVGRRNLAALVGAPDIEHHRVQQGDTEFDVLLGESFFTASLSLLLEDVVRHYAAADLSNGALVAVPNRHQLVWRAVDSPSVIPSLNGMIAFTQLGHDAGAGPVSRDVFWHHDGSWEKLTEMRGDEQVVNVGPELHAVLERLL
jgi:hypothetical protein